MRKERKFSVGLEEFDIVNADTICRGDQLLIGDSLRTVRSVRRYIDPGGTLTHVKFTFFEVSTDLTYIAGQKEYAVLKLNPDWIPIEAEPGFLEALKGL
jgi:hypothetical protein